MLQKILYYIQGYYLAEFDHPLFPDEILAWRFGPTVYSVFREFSHYDSKPLQFREWFHINRCTRREIKLINTVIDNKVRLSTKQLVEDTLREDPWLKATLHGSRIENTTVISTDVMKEYFKSLKGQYNAGGNYGT